MGYKLEFELIKHPEAHHFIVIVNKDVDDLKTEIREQTKYWKEIFNTPVKCIKHEKQ